MIVQLTQSDIDRYLGLRLDYRTRISPMAAAVVRALLPLRVSRAEQDWNGVTAATSIGTVRVDFPATWKANMRYHWLVGSDSRVTPFAEDVEVRHKQYCLAEIINNGTAPRPEPRPAYRPGLA